jgi:DNA helicase-2/ATP-dependent DNA helicase PcrA
LQSSPACRRYIQASFTHVFVDEYQDSGELQHQLFLDLHQLGLVAVAVGDRDQSIFKYLGREASYLNELMEEGSGFQPFSLSKNHRCHPSITNYANRVLSSTHPLLDTDSIEVHRVRVEGDQNQIATYIEQNVEHIKRQKNVEHNKDVAILVRNENTARIVSANLNMPHRVFAGDRLSDDSSDSSRILAALLRFRFDKQLTAQSIVDLFGRGALSVVQRKILRDQIQKCRSCDLGEFEAITSPLLNLLLDKKPPENSLAALREVLVGQLDSFMPIAQNELQILTLHKSKGLEFDIVFHLDLYDWIMPRREVVPGSYDEHFADFEQCRKSLYGIIVRAVKRCLYKLVAEEFFC